MSFDFNRALKREFNVGSKEQKTRYGVGLVLLLVSTFLANIPMLLIGIMLVVTAKMQWCPSWGQAHLEVLSQYQPWDQR